MITQSRLFCWVSWQWSMLLVNLAFFKQRYSPYARLAELKRSVARLEDCLRHVSCTCGKPLEWGSKPYGFIACEQCHHLATVDLHHDCSVYLGNGSYVCRSCVVSVVQAYGLFPLNEESPYPYEDEMLSWVESLPPGQFLALVQAHHDEIAFQLS